MKRFVVALLAIVVSMGLAIETSQAGSGEGIKLPASVAKRTKVLFSQAGLLKDKTGLTLERLAAGLQDDDPRIRRASVYALGESGDKRAVEMLIEALHNPDETTSRMAASALGKIHDRRAVGPLLETLGRAGGHRDLWCATLDALMRIGDARTRSELAARLSREGFVCPHCRVTYGRTLLTAGVFKSAQ